MNYLAHVFLSCDSAEAILGALYGDFAKGAHDVEYPAAIADAIRLHRAIDRYTDAHPIPCASRALVSPVRRRFAGILTDVFYDHFLARHWQDYCELPLPMFAHQVYAVLLAHQEQLPPRLRYVAPRMAANDWFGAYAELRGIDAAVNGIARRLEHYPRAAALRGGVAELERHYAAFEAHFREFFPLLIQHVRTCTNSTRPGAAADTIPTMRHVSIPVAVP